MYTESMFLIQFHLFGVFWICVSTQRKKKLFCFSLLWIIFTERDFPHFLNVFWVPFFYISWIKFFLQMFILRMGMYKRNFPYVCCVFFVFQRITRQPKCLLCEHVTRQCALRLTFCSSKRLKNWKRALLLIRTRNNRKMNK